MRKDLDEKLVKRFPVMFQDRFSPMSQTCMCWGFDCGDGWFQIIWDLCEAIDEELGYSWLQKKIFIFKKHFSVRWNALLYKLSPVRKEYTHLEGNGTKEKPFHRVKDGQDPPRWDERIAQFLFGKTKKICDGKIEVERLGIKTWRYDPYTGFAVTQVKEKFGELRFYVNGSSDTINNLIALAKGLSRQTCETCGATGRLGQRYGWYSTRCTACQPDRWKECI